MTRTPAPALSPAEAEVVARFDAAPVPPEVVVETVARALFDAANPIVSDFPDYWHRVTDGEETRNHYRRLAAAAIAALPPSPAEEAVKRVEAIAAIWESVANTWQETADHPNTGPEFRQHCIAERDDFRDRVTVLRAALASPAPAPQDGAQ